MKEIKLKNSVLKALIDDEDYEEVSKHTWTLQSGGYVRTFVGRSVVYLHRFVMRAEMGQEVDHWDTDKLNCAKGNLRFSSRSQNCANRHATKNNSGYKGIRWEEQRQRFLARIGINGRTINLGRYKTAEEAAEAYNNAAKEHYGEFSRLNEIKK